MIPIRDINPTREKPVVCWVFIAINALVFLYEVALGAEGMRQVTMTFGLIPDDLLAFLSGDEVRTTTELRRFMGRVVEVERDVEVSPIAWVTPLTSMFMHGGWMHIIGNMWFLHVFGDNVEDALGRVRFIAFYVLCGLGAALGQILVAPDSEIPMVGASGAISGVMAGYVLLYPQARVLTLVPIFIFLQFMELPAYLFIFIWFGFQLLSGYVSLGDVGSSGGVAWFAHIGGFVVGLALMWIMRPRGPRVYRRRREDVRRRQLDHDFWD